MTSLVDKIVAVAESLERHHVGYAFGGALALAYATLEPRGTRDIDVNVFVTANHAETLFADLPPQVEWTKGDVEAARRDDQVRLWWGDTPLDLFFDAAEIHHEAAGRARRVSFQDRTIMVLAPQDLAVFKVLFDRSKDWVDIEEMYRSGSLDLDAVAAAVEKLLGDDERVSRLRGISG